MDADETSSDDRFIIQSAVNEHFYLERRPEAAKHPGGIVEHYLSVGWKEGLDPSPGFSTCGYLRANPDVEELGVNPLVHYLRYGIAEGRIGHIQAQTAPYQPKFISHEDFAAWFSILPQWDRRRVGLAVADLVTLVEEIREAGGSEENPNVGNQRGAKIPGQLR